MKTINIISSQTTGLDPALATASTIEIEDKPIGAGTFGVAYRAGRFGGRQVAAQVVKILADIGPGVAQHGYDTVRELQRRLEVENRSVSGTLLQKIPALQAVPQFSFEGVLDGKRVLGYTSNDLTRRGFVEFGRVLDDDAPFRVFQALPIGSKMRIAAELVSAFDFLASRIRFIHADFKAEALFVDLQGLHCAIIDFDSGALARNATDSPITYGTMQDWLAPEIVKQLTAPGNSKRAIAVNLHSDAWSVNVAVHYLLLGMHPLFFLSEESERSTDAYFQQYQWPQIDSKFRFFRKDVAGNVPGYLWHLQNSIPDAIVKQFAFTVNRGYRVPPDRTSYSQWRAILGALNRPGIRHFNADRLVVNDGRPVHLTWDVTGAARLELTTVGDVTNRTSADVTVTRDTTFELVMTLNDGMTMRKSINITTDKTPPVIVSFTTNRQLLYDATPAQLAWIVTGAARLQIDNGVGDVTLAKETDVLPMRTTVFTLTAMSFFGATSTATVQVAVSSVPPSIAYFRADPDRLEGGQPLTLSWSVSADAHEVTISGMGRVAHAGTKVLDQRQPQAFLLTAKSVFGYESQASGSVDVSTRVPTIEEFRAAPILFRQGLETVITWKADGAERVLIDPGAIELPSAGSRAFRPDRPTTFVLRALSWYGKSASRQLDVAVVRKTELPRRTAARLDRSLLTKLPRRT